MVDSMAASSGGIVSHVLATVGRNRAQQGRSVVIAVLATAIVAACAAAPAPHGSPSASAATAWGTVTGVTPSPSASPLPSRSPESTPTAEPTLAPTPEPTPALTPKPTPRPLAAGYCPSPAAQYSKSATARAYVYGQYEPDWTAKLTLKVTVCVSKGKVAWSTMKVSQQKRPGVTGSLWYGTPSYLTKTSTERAVGVAATYKFAGQMAEPSLWITYKVGAGLGLSRATAQSQARRSA